MILSDEEKQVQKMNIMSSVIQADAYDKLLKARIQIENGISAKLREQMISEGVAEELYANISSELRTGHDRILKEMQKTVKQIPIYDQWLKHVRGIGPRHATKLIAYTQDIGRFPKVSMYWKYFGLSPVDYCENCKKRYFSEEWLAELWINKTYAKQTRMIADDNPNADARKTQIMKNIVNSVCHCDNPKPVNRAERKVVGISSVDYNPKCKDLMYLVTSQFVKQGKFYRLVYDDAKAYENAKYGMLYTKAHINYRANRRVAKLFMSHLWTKWRELEGLIVTEPYAKSYLNHEMIPVPEPGEDGKI
jgi:hypothetical protein